MPDPTGHLSPAEIRAIEDWISTKHRGPFVCPVSNDTVWVVNPYVLQDLIYPIMTPALPSAISPLAWPVVQLVCIGCGYELRFSAGLIGLYPPPLVQQPPLPPVAGQ